MKRLFTGLLVGCLVIYATLSLVRNLSNTLVPNFGFDFYSYWQPLQFVRQGINPYSQGLQGYRGVLTSPISYIDGTLLNADEWFDKFGRPIPANTPLMLVLLSPLSFLTWQVAKLVWLLLNTLCAATAIILTVQIVTGSWKANFSLVGIEFALIVMCLLPVRNTIGNGQTTLLIVTSMFVGLYFQIAHKSIFAGIALGIAFSKFTLGIALLLYFLYKREWKAIIVAGLIQVLGVLLISLLTNTSILTTVLDYSRLVAFHADKSGIHLGSYLPLHPLVVSALVTLLFVCLTWFVRRSVLNREVQKLRDLLIFGLACNWSLLTIYHSYYDLTLLIFELFILLLISNNQFAGVSTRITVTLPRSFLLTLTSLIVTLLALPGTIVQDLMPASAFETYLQLITFAGTLVVMMMTALFVWVLKTLNVDRIE